MKSSSQIGVILGIAFACAVMVSAFTACSREKAGYRFQPGESLKYKLWTAQEVILDAMPGSQRVNLHTDLTVTVKTVDASGTADLDIQASNFRASMSDDDGRKPLEELSKLPPIVYPAKQKADGSLEIQMPASIPQGLDAIAISFMRSIRELFLTLPATLNRGTAWARTVEVSETVSPGGALVTKTQTQFEAGETTRIENREAVEISGKLQITLEGRNSDPTRGDGQGSATYYFSTKLGRLLGSKVDTEIRLDDGESQGARLIRSHVQLRLADSQL